MVRKGLESWRAREKWNFLSFRAKNYGKEIKPNVYVCGRIWHIIQ